MTYILIYIGVILILFGITIALVQINKKEKRN